MGLNVHYVTNKKGIHTAVQIPIRDWRMYQREVDKMRRLTEFANGLREAIKEIDDISKGKKKGVTLSEFLNEL